MGNCGAKNGSADERAQNARIDDELAKDFKQEKKIIKLLLLGTHFTIFSLNHPH
jgi:hypothetical protein